MRKILLMVSSLTYTKPDGSHTGPSVNPKPEATVSSFASRLTSFQNSGDDACNSKLRRGSCAEATSPVDVTTASRNVIIIASTKKRSLVPMFRLHVRLSIIYVHPRACEHSPARRSV